MNIIERRNLKVKILKYYEPAHLCLIFNQDYKSDIAQNFLKCIKHTIPYAVKTFDYDILVSLKRLAISYHIIDE